MLYILIAGIIVCVILLIVSIVKSHKLKNTKITTDNLIGSTGKVIKKIGPNSLNNGLIKLDGEVWVASSQNNKSIPKGETVVVTRIEGVRAIVLPTKSA